MARSGPGPGSVRCLPVFPKVDAASPRGLSQPPGLSAWAARVRSPVIGFALQAG